ncbi:MAG: (2Fe-2S)-binding protein [Rickettsiales bacterium]|nr:(2Fe-2S)-binding protein [Rickettsiales bacterium]
MAKLSLEANGQTCEIEVDPLVPLVTVLRDDLGLRGTKVGCGNGECGACTVLMDGQAVCSCLVPAGRANGRRIDTIESLGNSDEMHPLQRKLVERGAFQCGFCTPGVVMSLVALLRRKPEPDDQDITAALQGNLCRCSGYVKLLKSVRESIRETSRER